MHAPEIISVVVIRIQIRMTIITKNNSSKHRKNLIVTLVGLRVRTVQTSRLNIMLVPSTELRGRPPGQTWHIPRPAWRYCSALAKSKALVSNMIIHCLITLRCTALVESLQPEDSA